MTLSPNNVYTYSYTPMHVLCIYLFVREISRVLTGLWELLSRPNISNMIIPLGGDGRPGSRSGSGHSSELRNMSAQHGPRQL